MIGSIKEEIVSGLLPFFLWLCQEKRMRMSVLNSLKWKIQNQWIGQERYEMRSQEDLQGKINDRQVHITVQHDKLCIK